MKLVDASCPAYIQVAVMDAGKIIGYIHTHDLTPTILAVSLNGPVISARCPDIDSALEFAASRNS